MKYGDKTGIRYYSNGFKAYYLPFGLMQGSKSGATKVFLDYPLL